MSEPSHIQHQDMHKRKLTMKISIIDGLLLVLFLINSGGPFTISYALKLEANKFQIGLLVAIPLFAQIFSLFGPWLVSKFGKRKFPAIITGIIGRSLWGVAIFAPIMIAVGSSKFDIFLIGVALSNIFLAINNSIWHEWIIKIVPAKDCGSYFAWRNALMTFVGSGINIIFGFWLDSIGTPIWAIQLILFLCVLLSLLAGVALGFYYEPNEKIEKISLWRSLSDPFKDFNFTKTMIAIFVCTFGLGMLMAGTATFLIEDVKMSLGQMSIWTAITAVSVFLLAKKYGSTIDISGSKPMLKISMVIIGIILPLCYILTSSNSIWMAYIAAILEGSILGIVGPAFLRLVSKVSTGKHIGSCMAWFVAINGFGACLGALSFGPLYNFFSQFSFVVFGIEWNGYRSYFMINILIKISSLSIINSVFEENAWTVRKTTKYILATVFRRKEARSIESDE